MEAYRYGDRVVRCRAVGFFHLVVLSHHHGRFRGIAHCTRWWLVRRGQLLLFGVRRLLLALEPRLYLLGLPPLVEAHRLDPLPQRGRWRDDTVSYLSDAVRQSAHAATRRYYVEPAGEPGGQLTATYAVLGCKKLGLARLGSANNDATLGSCSFGLFCFVGSITSRARRDPPSSAPLSSSEP